ncbi:MAG: ferredoxin [Gammaproteobacteria bacterium]
MKIVKSENRCVSSGHCCQVAPGVFEMRRGTMIVLRPEVSPETREAVEKAVATCPAEALALESV